MIGNLQPAAAAVGNTPVLWIDEPTPDGGRGYWAKLEGFNFGGIKDRAALHMVERARARGELRPGAPIVESTSGTLGLGLALAGVHYGHPVHIVTDPGLEPIVERMLTAHGARVHLVREPGPVGGWQQARVERVAALMERLGHPRFAVKANANFPGNRESSGLPTIQGVIALFDGATGAQRWQSRIDVGGNRRRTRAPERAHDVDPLSSTREEDGGHDA